MASLNQSPTTCSMISSASLTEKKDSGENRNQLPLSRLNRQYRCDKCSFITNRSRLHLFHLAVEHQDARSVALCVHCDYASRWRCKVTRHHNMLHKDHPPIKDQDVLVKDAQLILEEYMKNDEILDRMLHDDGREICLKDTMEQMEHKEQSSQNSNPHETGKLNGRSDSTQINKFTDQLVVNGNEISERRQSSPSRSSEVNCVQAEKRAEETSNNTNFNTQLVSQTELSLPSPNPIPCVSQTNQNVDEMVCICPVCGYSAPSPTLQDEHMELVHGESSSLAIDQSGSNVDSSFPIDAKEGSSVSEEDYEEKSLQLDDKEGSVGNSAVDSRRRYRCNVCTATFPWHGNLSEHLREMHGLEKPRDWRGKAGNYRCTHCKYVAKYQSELRRHMRLHLGVKPFGCVFCKYRSAWKGDLKRHIESHHREKFESDLELNSIMSRYKNNAGTEFKTNHDATDGDGAGGCSAGETAFSPDPVNCLENSNDESTGGLFDQCSTGPVPSVLPIEGTPSPSYLPFQSANQSLDQTGSGASKDRASVGRLPCSQCNYMAQNQSKLNNHMASHTNLRLFRCPVCGQRSNYKWDVRKHIKSQHPDQAQLDVIRLSHEEALQMTLIENYNDTESQKGDEDALEQGEIVPNPENCLIASNNYSVEKFGQHETPKLTDTKPDSVSDEPNYCMPGQQLRSSLDLATFQSYMDANRAVALSNPSYMFGLQENLFLGGMLQQMALSQSALSTPNGNFQSALRSWTTGQSFHRTANDLETTKTSCNQSRSENTTPFPSCTGPSQPGQVVSGITCRSATGSVVDNTSDSDDRISVPSSLGVARNSHESSVAGALHISSGYIKGEQFKRFKCSGCGHRSNWKWDINKHIKVAHPERSGIRTIQLSIAEAQATLGSYLSSARAGKARAQGSGDPDEGYYRPFQCSLCGHRSNWKWDVNKHLKQVHQGEGSVITLSMDEAKRTIALYKDRRRLTQSAISQSENSQSCETSKFATTGSSKRSSGHVAHHPKSTNQQSSIPRIDCLRLKRFKCSACGYRSNYRSDIARHNRRKHRGEGRIIVLPEVEAKHSLDQYVRSFPQRSNALFRKSLVASGVSHLVLPSVNRMSSGVRSAQNIPVKRQGPALSWKTKPGQESRKYWSCSLCSFVSRDKVPVMRHITRVHKPARPFSCRLCAYSTDYRNSLIRHIRARHDSINYLAHIHTNMHKIREIKNGHVAKIQTEQIPGTMPTFQHPSSPSPPLPPPVAPLLEQRCPVCPQLFDTIPDLLLHCIENHANSDEEMYLLFKCNDDQASCHDYRLCLPCSHCPFLADSQEVLQIHQMQHSSECKFQYKCAYCSFRASHPKFLKVHEKLHENSTEPSGPQDLSIPRRDKFSEDEPHDLSLPKVAPNCETFSSIKRPREEECLANMDDSDVMDEPQMKRLREEDGFFYCGQCPFLTDTRRGLLVHKQRHRPNTKASFSCPMCKFFVVRHSLIIRHSQVHSTDYTESRKQHLTQKNTAEMTPLANYAHQNLLSDNPAAVHIAFHLQKIRELLADQLCKDQNGNISTETEFLSRFRTGGGLFCDECPFIALSKQDLVEHISRHGAAEKWKCTICDYASDSKSALKEHWSTHNTASNSNLCKLLTNPHVQQAWYSVHSLLSPAGDYSQLALHPPDRCAHCPYQTDCEEKLSHHLRYHGATDLLYQCSVCNYRHSRTISLLRHQKLHSTETQVQII